MGELLEEFRDYSMRGGQVFISTHSPDLLNHAKPEEVYWLVKKSGYTNVFCAENDEAIKALYNEGELLGYLWKQDYFKNSSPQ